jgi:gluconate 2-dehydrogenase gamma chain
MHNDPLDRRQFLRACGTLALWFTAAPAILRADALDAPSGESQAPALKILSPTQAATFTAFASQVIPSEPGSPGAREANVTRFADNGLASHVAAQRPVFLQALVALEAEATRVVPGAKGFAALTQSQQVDVMRAFDASHHDLFETLRVPVVVGMFSNPSYGGNAKKVGWEMIGFEDRFYWTAPFGYYDTPAQLRHDD